jgi:hypothetical protein
MRANKDPFWDRKFNLCPVGAANSTQVAGKPTATICDKHLRTINTHGADVPNGPNRCGGPDDWYYYSPWRAPGSAPVLRVATGRAAIRAPSCVFP